MCWGRGEVLATVIYSAALTNVTCEMKSVLDAFQGHCLLIYLCLMTKPYAIQCTECKKNQRHIYPTIFSIVYFTLLVSWHCSENPFMGFSLFKTWVLSLFFQQQPYLFSASIIEMLLAVLRHQHSSYFQCLVCNINLWNTASTRKYCRSHHRVRHLA